MLEQLRISQFILVDEWIVDFQKGLNVISGESGSGKSAIIQAINLLIGGKSDKDKVRSGASQALIEGIFSDPPKPVQELLNQSGINTEDELIIRRIIFADGKSRAFINDCSTSLSLLKSLAPLLFDPINQHASVQLQSSHQHRILLDEFGGYSQVLKDYQKAFSSFHQIENEYNDLRQKQTHREHRSIEIEKSLEELEKADIKEGEEEDLYQEYKTLTEGKESCEKIQDFLNNFDHIHPGGFNFCQSIKQNVNYLSNHIENVPELKTILESLTTIIPEIEDAHYSLQQLANQYYQDPHKENYLQDRLSLIHKLRKQFLCTESDQLLSLQETLLDELDNLNNLNQRQIELEELLPSQEKQMIEKGNKLSLSRKKASEKLTHATTKILKQLNMDHASLSIDFNTAPATTFGFETVDFSLKANRGEKDISLKNAASGGEMARVLLAIKLASNHSTSFQTMILDEVDASIGGKTAKKMALLIKKRAQNQQIICITHFAQVAEEADHHICIEKQTSSNRTIAKFKILKQTEREKELHRMVGESSRVTIQNELLISS